MPEPKFHRLHYNFVAKRLRNHYPKGDTYTPEGGLAVQIGARRVVENLALEFANRFKNDNPDFDPIAFLDQCSPDPDLYPFSEMWEDYVETVELHDS